MSSDAPNFRNQRLPPCMDNSCHKLGGKLKYAPKMNGSFPSLVRKRTSCIKLALMSLRKPTECPKEAVNNKISLPMTRMTFPANRRVGQRTPASSVHTDKGLENQRVRTSASTPALVPFLAVLIAALPVPAHENFRASLAPVSLFPSGFRK